MKLNEKNMTHIKELKMILYSVCHAPKCKDTPYCCPIVCGCKRFRTFKLDYNTSACWEMAGFLGWINITDIERVKCSFEAIIGTMGRHSKTKWMKFFRMVSYVISYVEYETERNTPLCRSIDKKLKEMKKLIPYLSRKKKWNIFRR